MMTTQQRPLTLVTKRVMHVTAARATTKKIRSRKVKTPAERSAARTTKHHSAAVGRFTMKTPSRTALLAQNASTNTTFANTLKRADERT